MSDRRVHARTRGGWEVVRYDKAGKWYLELFPTAKVRNRLSLREAAEYAVNSDAEIFFGLPGGGQFDVTVRRMLSYRRSNTL